MEKLYNLYCIEKNRLGDDDEYDMKYTSLCRKCYDEAETNEKKHTKKAIQYDKHKAVWKKEVAALNKKVDVSNKEAVALKKEVARLTEEITKLNEMNIVHNESITNPIEIYTDYNDTQTVIDDSVAKIMEEVCKTLTESRVYHNEETHGPTGELKRKHSGETEVVNNTPTEPINIHNETQTMECNSCKGTKPLSSFQTKSREKTKSGRIAEYLITRKMCRSCRDMKYNHTKKSKTS